MGWLRSYIAWNTRVHARAEAWTERWLFPFAAVLVLAVTPFAWSNLAPAYRNDGTFGTFTAHIEECSRRTGCSWRGDFRSDNGAIVAHDVAYDGPGIGRPGDTARAQATRTHELGEVYPAGSRFIFVLLGLDGVAVSYLAWRVRRRIRRRDSTS